MPLFKSSLPVSASGRRSHLRRLASLAAATNHVAGAAYSWSYLILGFMMLVTAIETLRLPPDAGAAVTRSCPAPGSQE